jgi:hypothetical protein
MNAAIAVFRQELGERKRVFIVAAAIAVLPFLISTLPSLAGQRDMAIASIAIYGAVIYSVALALALGSSMIARPLAEKRLSFYLARPIPIGALWSGKLAANLLACFASTLIITVPSVLFAFDAAQTHWGVAGEGLSALVFLGVPFLMLATHFVATFTRSRSIRLVADFVLLVAAVYAAILIIRPVLVGGAFEAARTIAACAGIGLLAALLFAPLWQLARGRADIRLSHAALSTALWVSIAVILTGIAGYSMWVTRAPLSSIRTWGGVEQTADGKMLVATGESSRGGFYASHLIDVTKGKSRRLPELAPWSEVYISRDGSTLVTERLTELLPRRGDSDLVLTALDSRGVSNIIPSSGRTTAVTMTADARRIAVSTNTSVTVYDSTSGSMLGAAKTGNRLIRRMLFVSPTLLRLITTNGQGKEQAIDELDLTTRTLRRTGAIAGEADGWFVVSTDHTRLLTRSRVRGGETPPAAREVTVVDGRTGAPLFVPPPMFTHTLLNDGRVAGVEAGDQQGRLHVYSTDGAPQKTLQLPVAKAGFVGQSGPSIILLRSGDALLIADLDAGTVRRIADARVMPSYRDGQLGNYPQGALLAGLDTDKKLALWNISTGRRQQLPQ